MPLQGKDPVSVRQGPTQHWRLASGSRVAKDISEQHPESSSHILIQATTKRLW